ncbi:hypothetical protein J6590_051795 [Homalodisca vitripennis]|nr:hypothetical protein J6590_051795 [Homalodisca vitripennis]
MSDQSHTQHWRALERYSAGSVMSCHPPPYKCGGGPALSSHITTVLLYGKFFNTAHYRSILSEAEQMHSVSVSCCVCSSQCDKL